MDVDETMLQSPVPPAEHLAMLSGDSILTHADFQCQVRREEKSIKTEKEATGKVSKEYPGTEEALIPGLI